MSETKTPSEKTLSVHSTKTLTLKPRGEQGVVRQSFSHGRTKPVVVEKVKRRVLGDKPEASAATAERVAASLRPSGKAATPAATPQKPATAPAAATAPKPSGVLLRTLTAEERSARDNALTDFRVREAEERKIAEEEARRRNERDARVRVEREAAEAR
jgi:translation initiation factor IF-2